MNFNRLMLASVLSGLIAPVYATTPSYCIAVDGGFNGKGGGTSFIGRGFTLPAAGACASWSGFTKTAASVILTTTGGGCTSSDGKVFTLSVSSVDPEYTGTNPVQDYIQLCPEGTKECPLSPNDNGYFSGAAATQTCTSALLELPSTHD